MTDRTFFLSRDELARAFDNPRMVAAFEDLQNTVAETAVSSRANVDATDTLNEAAFLTLSENAELPNERVLALGRGLRFELSAGEALLETDFPVVADGYRVTLIAGGDSEVVLPLSGILATRENAEVLKAKTLDAPLLSGIGNHADDAAAATAGVPVGGIYRTASALKVRVS